MAEMPEVDNGLFLKVLREEIHHNMYALQKISNNARTKGYQIP